VSAVQELVGKGTFEDVLKTVNKQGFYKFRPNRRGTCL